MQTPTPDSDKIIVNLTPPSVRMLAGGDPVELTATVQNAGSEKDQFQIDVAGIDPSWYTIEIEGVVLTPGDTVTAPIILHPPKDGTIQVGKYVFTVQAASLKDPSHFGSTPGTIEIIGSKSISLTLNPTDVEWAAGSPPVQLTAEVQNVGVTVDKYDIEIEGLEPSWYTVSVQEAALFPEDKAPILIKINPPMGADTPAGHYVFELRARSQAHPNLVESTMGVFYVVPKQDYDIVVNEPQRITGRSGQYSLTLSNEGNVGIRLDMSATDPDGALSYKFQVPDPKVVVQQHSTAKVTLAVKPKKPKLIGPKQIYQFDVIARALGADKDQDPSNDFKTAQGTLMYTPYLANWRLPGASILAALVFLLWALPVWGPWFSACDKPLIGLLCPAVAATAVPPPTQGTTPVVSAGVSPTSPAGTITTTVQPAPIVIVEKYRIEDDQFTGGPPLGKNEYRGKSAIVVYGQRSKYHAITARFFQPTDAKRPPPKVPVTLTIQGVDSEDQSKTPLRIKLENNLGTWETLELDPLNNDFPLRTSTNPNANWDTHSWALGPGKIADENVLTIENLDPNGADDDPVFFALDWVELSWTP